MYATDRRQTDVRQRDVRRQKKTSFNVPPIRGRDIITKRCGGGSAPERDSSDAEAKKNDLLLLQYLILSLRVT